MPREKSVTIIITKHDKNQYVTSLTSFWLIIVQINIMKTIKGLLAINIDTHIAVINTMPKLKEDAIDATSRCVQSLLGGREIIFCGNGGSAADSQHLAAEFTGRFLIDRMPLPGRAGPSF